jgi:F0F1-type ATP synthase membrane subunit b/b'
MWARLLTCIALLAPAVSFAPVYVTEQQRHSVRLHVSTRVEDANKESKNVFAKAKLSMPWSKAPVPPSLPDPVSPPEATFSASSYAPPSLSLDVEAFATAAGGAMLGAGMGILAALSQPELADLDPAVSAVVMGGAALAAATQDNDGGRLAKKLLGNPTQAIGKFLVDQFKSVLDSATKTITAIPNRIAAAIQRQINQAKDEIAALPERFVKMLRRKADEAVAEVQSIPQKLSDAAAQAADDLMEDIRRTAQEAANEAKMLPQRLTVAAKKKADETAEEALLYLEDMVEEAKALPGRKKEQVMAFLKGESSNGMARTPQPPKTPPTL